MRLKEGRQSATISVMRTNEKGEINSTTILLILTILLLLIALGFGAWAYSSRQDFKQNSDKKSDKAVNLAIKETESKKDNEFLEKEKEPLRDYKGPVGLGSISFKYPKTWSATIKDSDEEMSLIMHPLIVSTNEKKTYALRVEVVNESYDKLVDQQETNIKRGFVTATPYSLKSLPNVVGVRIDGQITKEKNGSMILLPLRDKTLRISTESPDFRGDLDKTILPTFSYAP